MVAQLLKVVDHADDPKHQGEEEHIQVVIAPRLQLLPARHQNRRADGQDKHDAAHGGGALLGHVPGGAVLPDGLTGLQPPQQGNQQLARNRRHAEGHNKAEDICHN